MTRGTNLFKKAVKSLFQVDYIVTVENGDYVVKEKDSKKEHLSFSVDVENKEKLLVQFYVDVLDKFGQVDKIENTSI